MFHTTPISHVVAWVRARRPSLPHPLPPVECKRAGPGIANVGELALSLNSCSKQVSRLCTLSEQQARVGPVIRGAGEAALRA